MADGEHQRVLEGLVVPLRDGENHGVAGGAGVKFRRADQIAHVLQDSQIQIVGPQAVQTLPGHASIQVAHAAGMELDDPGPRARDGLGVHAGVDVRLHHADAEFVLQRGNGPLQRGGLPRAGGGHQVEQEGLLGAQAHPEQIGLPVIALKDALLDLQDAKFSHGIHLS